MQKKYLIIILIIIFLLFLLVLISCSKQPTKAGTHYMLQYTGIPKECDPPQITPYSEVKIEDYKITTEVSSEQSIYKFLGCQENTCNGAYQQKDSYGCDVWEYYQQEIVPSCQGDIRNEGCVAYNKGTYSTTYCGNQVNCYDWDFYGGSCPTFDVYANCQHTCGGANLETIKSGVDCYSKHKIYYKDNLIYETPEWIWGDSYLYLKEGQQVPMGQNDIEIVLHYASQSSTSWFNLDCYGGHERVDRGCYYVKNMFSIKRVDTTLSVENAKFDGSTLSFNTKITNNQDELKGELKLKITVYYKFLGQDKEQSQEINYSMQIPNGENIKDYSFPIEVNANKIIIEPALTIISPQGGITGLNYYCYPNPSYLEQDVSQCDVSLGNIIGDTITLEITQECETDIDCLNNAPCKEINAECTNYKCIYSGECKKKNNIAYYITGGIVGLLGTIGIISRKYLFS